MTLHRKHGQGMPVKVERNFNASESEAILKEAEQLLEGGDAEDARCLASSLSRPSISSKDPAEQRLGGQALLLEARCCEVLGKLAEAAHLYAGAGFTLRCPRLVLRAARTHGSAKSN